MAIKQKKILALYHNMKGFLKARKKRLPKMVTKDEGEFIRNLRWKGIKKKLIS